MRDYIQSFKWVMETPHKSISGSPADSNESEKSTMSP